MCLDRAAWVERIGFYQSCGNRGSVGRVSVFWLRWCRWGMCRGLGPGSGVVTRFCEEQRQTSGGSTRPACQKNRKPGTHCWRREGLTQFAQQFVTAVKTPPLVGCVVWVPLVLYVSCHSMIYFTLLEYCCACIKCNTLHYTCTQHHTSQHNRYTHSISMYTIWYLQNYI